MKCFWTLRLAAIFAVAALTGCGTTRQALAPAVDLRASNADILVNETTTVFAKTENLVGMDPNVRWNTSLGELEVSEDGQQARLRADEAGTAYVTIEVTTADGQVLRDQQKIEIKPPPLNSATHTTRLSIGSRWSETM